MPAVPHTSSALYILTFVATLWNKYFYQPHAANEETWLQRDGGEGLRSSQESQDSDSGSLTPEPRNLTILLRNFLRAFVLWAVWKGDWDHTEAVQANKSTSLRRDLASLYTSRFGWRAELHRDWREKVGVFLSQWGGDPHRPCPLDQPNLSPLRTAIAFLWTWLAAGPTG